MSDKPKDDDAKKAEPKSAEPDKPLSALEQWNNLMKGLGYSQGEGDAMLRGDRDALVTERVMKYVEKQLARVSVGDREKVLKRLNADVGLRYLLEIDKPGIGAEEVYKTKQELREFAKAELKRARERGEVGSEEWVKSVMKRKMPPGRVM